MATLEVTVVSCRGVQGGDLFSEADPYVFLKLGRNTQRTQVQQDAGADANFNETFRFQCPGGALPALEVSVYDKDFLLDQLMGKATVDLKVVLTNNYWFGDVQLSKGSRSNGHVTMGVRLLPASC